MDAPKFYAGHLIHLDVKDLIQPETAKAMPLDDLTEIARGRVSDTLARFIAKHFLVIKTQEDGSVLVQTRITALVSEVPEGLAHTTIMFREVPRD
jgi:hypothetical protein